MTQITTEEKNQFHFIMISGEIDAGSSILLDNAFKEAVEKGKKRIAVNLSELSYISSAGLGVFISHLDEFEAEKIKLVLFGANESVREVFSILGLEKLLVMVGSEEEASNYLDE
ncbi:MAG: STAS domain-containing protein [Bacteroidota bacterium]